MIRTRRRCLQTEDLCCSRAAASPISSACCCFKMLSQLRTISKLTIYMLSQEIVSKLELMRISELELICFGSNKMMFWREGSYGVARMKEDAIVIIESEHKKSC